MQRTPEQNNIYRRVRFGVTLIEMIVVLAVIGILMALFLPAVQSVRASARRTQCASNMRQFAMQKDESRIREIAMCPDDPEGLLRRFSYFRNKAGNSNHTQFATSSTFALFELEEGIANRSTMDAKDWFSPTNVANGTVWDEVQQHVAAGRHIGRTANYLYHDGHIQVIPMSAIKEWSTSGFNFALPENGTYPPQ